MTIRGGPVVGSGGGGIAPNFTALTGKANLAISDAGGLMMTWNAPAGEGTQGFTLNVDNATLKCTVAGTYMLFASLQFKWTPTAATPALDLLTFFNLFIADGSALGNIFSCNVWTQINQSLTPNGDSIFDELISPPLAFAVNDTFNVVCQSLEVPAVGVNPLLAALESQLAIVRIQ